MISFPSLLLIALVAETVRVLSVAWPRVLAVGAGLCLVAVLLVGSGTQRARGLSISPWTESGDSKTADLLEQAADKQFPGADDVTFAHLGFNDEDAVGAFVDDRFDLACPQLAQYSFTPEKDLTGVLDCIETEQPCLVLVTPSFRETPGPDSPAPWRSFLERGATLLSDDYRSVDSQPFTISSRGANGAAAVSGSIQAYAVRDPAACAA
jgi:hypothetical protein